MIAVLDHSQTDLAQATVLSLFVPILLGIGGKLNSQTVTTIIRAMADGEAALRHALRIHGREMLTGLALSATVAMLRGFRGFSNDDGGRR